MKTIVRGALLIIFGTCVMIAGEQIPRKQYATVKLKILDSYGRSRQGCRVTEFHLHKPEGDAEYRGSFDALVASKIPFGNTYSVLVKCADGSIASYPYVGVTHSEQLLVLVSWIPDEDYVTGPEPRLAIAVSTDSKSRLSDHAWVKAVGVYADGTEVAQVDPVTGVAGLYSIVPGRIIILILDGEKLICTQQINFLREHAHLALSLTPDGCKAQGDSLVVVAN